MMRKHICLALALATVAATPAAARDTRYELKIADVLADPRYAEAVPAGVKFYFADQPAPAGKDLGEFVTNRKTNSFGKQDEEACTWAMLSALKELGERALAERGNAVVGIVSYYKKQPFASATDYECHAGAIVAGVALKGTVVKVAP
nr:excinuclease ABC subunit A [uncultured Dongia sp.]